MNEQLINELCQKFHTTVDNLIPVYAKYAMTKDIVSGIICLLIIIICAIITILMVKRGIEKEYYKDILDTPFSYMLIHICACVAIIICIIALFVISMIIFCGIIICR